MKTLNALPIIDCRQCQARAQSSFCGLLKDDEINLFMQLKKDHLYQKNQALFYEGHSCDTIYLLCNGSVKLVQSSDAGHQQIDEVVSPGGWVDKGAAFSSGRHSVTAQALENSVVSLLSVAQILPNLKSLPSLSLTLITALSKEVDKGRERLRLLRTKSAKARLASVLLGLCRTHGVKQDHGISIKLALKREELAEMVCVTQETVVRLLTSLKKEGLIQLSGKEITILQEQGLSRILNH